MPIEHCPGWHHWRPEGDTYRCRECNRRVDRSEWE